MGNMDDNPAQGGKKADDATGLKHEEDKDQGSTNHLTTDHSYKHDSRNGKGGINPLIWLTETFSGKTTHAIQGLEFPLRSQILDKLPLVLDGIIQGPALKKTYDISLSPEDDAQRKFPDANVPANIKELYVKMRKAQLEHVAIETRLNVTERASLAAWTAFPENDDDCKAGRELTQRFMEKALGNNIGLPLSAYKRDEEDNKLLAKIYSLQVNDHDYQHNEDEITRDNGARHLPEKFIGVAFDKDTGQFKPEEYNLKALAEKHMFAVLQGTYKSPLTPNERANLAFYSQVLRQVLPDSLLEDAQEGQRNSLLEEYAKLYQLRDYNLSAVGPAIMQQGVRDAEAKYPDAAHLANLKLKPIISDGEELYQLLTLADIRQLHLEQFEILQLAGMPGAVRAVPPKPAELAYPDKARLSGFSSNTFSKVRIALREYDEGHRLGERAFIRTVQEAFAKQFVGNGAQEPGRLAAWQSTPTQWELVYLANNPNNTYNAVQREAWQRWPAARTCGNSFEGASLFVQYQDQNYLRLADADKERIEKRLGVLQIKLTPVNGINECPHGAIPRRKDNIR